MGPPLWLPIFGESKNAFGTDLTYVRPVWTVESNTINLTHLAGEDGVWNASGCGTWLSLWRKGLVSELHVGLSICLV